VPVLCVVDFHQSHTLPPLHICSAGRITRLPPRRRPHSITVEAMQKKGVFNVSAGPDPVAGLSAGRSQNHGQG
jgi:hypothetical protein